MADPNITAPPIQQPPAPPISAPPATGGTSDNIDFAALLRQLQQNSAQYRAATAPMTAQAMKIASEPTPIPQAPALSPLPQAPNTASIVDPMRQMSPLLLFLSLAGGALTGAPLTGAFKAGAAYINGIKQGQTQKAQLARQDFEDKLKQATDINTQKLEQYKAVLESTNLSISDKANRLRAIAIAHGDEQTAALLDQGNIKTAVDAMAAQARAQQTITMQKEMMDLRIAQTFKPAAIALADGRLVDGMFSPVGGYQDVKGNPIPAADVTHVYVGVPAEGIVTADTAKRAAEMAVDKGDFRDAVQSAGGFGNVGNINRGIIANAITSYAQSKGMNGADISAKIAQFHAQLAAASSVGRILGTTAQGTQELQQFAPLVKQLSDRISRTQFPTINSLQLAVEKGTGSPDVVQLNSYVQSIRNAYVLVMSRGGRLTDTQRKYAGELIDGSLATGQINAALDALVTEGGVAQTSAQRALQEVTGQPVTTAPSAPSTQYSAPGGSSAPTRSKW